jgi:hypothetical protein
MYRPKVSFRVGEFGLDHQHEAKDDDDDDDDAHVIPLTEGDPKEKDLSLSGTCVYSHQRPASNGQLLARVGRSVGEWI